MAQALTLSSFVPDDQDKKLALIADANGLLDATLNPFDVKPPPSDAELVASFKATAAKLQRRRGGKPTTAAPMPAALADALDGGGRGGPAARARATEAMVPGAQNHAAAIVGFADRPRPSPSPACRRT